MAFISEEPSAEEIELRLGTQVRELRLRRGWDQSQLAEASGASLGAVRNLEQGKGSTLRTIARVAIALDRADWFSALSPAATISPIEILRKGRRPTRRRVYRSRRQGT